jgi:A/G-specific adenine glycosylase
MRADPVAPGAIRRLRAPLLRWYRRHARELPWRSTTDPYAIWVSEVMLQQTTVAAVLPYWERFLERFPDLPALARAEEDDVLASWSGLGYYRRARALRHGAIAVMERHSGRVPSDPEELIALPGIGRYTAGAIASVAYGREAPVVDGNVKRVFSRLFATGEALRPLREPAMWTIAATLVRGRDPGDLNQAVMELGATVCTPRAPACPACPVASHCRALAIGQLPEAPARRPAGASRIVKVGALWIVERGRVLLERKRSEGPLKGEWDVPAVVVGPKRDPRRGLAATYARRHELRLRIGPAAGSVRHAILRTVLAIDVFPANLVAPAPRSRSLRWVEIERLDQVPHSGATRKIVRLGGAAGQKRSHAARRGRSSAAGSSSGARPRSTA